jgi:RimJ/RimL family protein N-acetyltransferase
MYSMAAQPGILSKTALGCRLVPFERAWAELVASWVRDAREAYWVAPKSKPPVTAHEVLRWQRPGHQAYAVVRGDVEAPIGYGELNPMPQPQRHYWLGHLIVDPAVRGNGYGVQLTRLLVEEALERRGARRVTLVVFPENVVALACYRAAGMVDDGCEWHNFPLYGRCECLVRLSCGCA